jgi:glucuronosyltransferase
MDNIAQKYFGKFTPLPSEIEKNISLVMVNTHYSLDYPRPLVPAMITVGGLHITPGRELQNVRLFFCISQKCILHSL